MSQSSAAKAKKKFLKADVEALCDALEAGDIEEAKQLAFAASGFYTKRTTKTKWGRSVKDADEVWPMVMTLDIGDLDLPPFAPHVDLDAEFDGRTPMRLAVDAGRLDVLEALEKLGAKLEDPDGSLLRLAAHGKNSFALIQKLLPTSDPNARSSIGRTALMGAAVGGFGVGGALASGVGPGGRRRSWTGRADACRRESH